MLRCGVGTPTPCINFLFSSSSCTRCFNRSERHTIQGCLFDEKPRETCNNCRSYNQRQSGVRALPKYVGWSETAHQRLLPSSDVQCRSSTSSVMGTSDLFLIIYSKPGCHLCNGLKDKVQAVLDKAMFQPSPLSNASLQIRNILEEPEWESAYGLAIPVMTAIKSGQSEEIKIPRSPPRISAERLSDHIVKSLKL